ncbi:MAG: ATP-binding protein [Proteobacteria bacterium]|nr:MAG: ATP-binding protein [Pseudomonadota bacterium]
MGRVEQLLTLRVPAEAAALKVVREQLQNALEGTGVDGDTRHQLVVAVNEACMNVIQHAYGAQRSGDMVLMLERESGWLTFRIIDFAPTVDTSTLQPRDLSEVRPGGLGLSLIHKIMDEIRYPAPPPDGGNVLEMRKRYPPAIADGG